MWPYRWSRVFKELFCRRLTLDSALPSRRLPSGMAMPSSMSITTQRWAGADPIGDRPGFKAMLDRIAGNGVRTCEVAGSDSMPWIFYKTSYTRAFLGGPPTGGRDRNILVAYGTCAKF
jgi:hypothetical protein